MWRQDADVHIEGRTAGGTVWLPDDMRIEGVDRQPFGLGSNAEIQPLTLRLTVDARKNQILLID